MKYFFGICVVFAVMAIASFTKNSPAGATKDNIMGVTGVTLPEVIEFAGEKVPVSYFDVKEGLERELLVNTYWHSQTLLLIKRAKRYFSLIEPILKKNNVPADFKYLALAESGFANVISPSGAVGFWQFLQTTGKEYGLVINTEIDERYHVEKSTEAACKYLSSSHNLYGSWTMAAASYNCGRSGLNKQIQRQYSTNYYDLLLNDETARYIYRIVALKLILDNPADYGFNLTESDLYQPIPSKEVAVSTQIKDLAQFAFDQGTNYKILKILNPWLRDNFITNKEARTYYIKIPEKGYRVHDRQLNVNDANAIGMIGDSTIR